jgi:hypothetical protein
VQRANSATDSVSSATLPTIRLPTQPIKIGKNAVQFAVEHLRRTWPLWVKSRHDAIPWAMSALPPKADIGASSPHVRLVPCPDLRKHDRRRLAQLHLRIAQRFKPAPQRRAAKYGWTRSCGPSPLAPARLALRVAGVPCARLRRHLVCNLSCKLLRSLGAIAFINP